MAEKFTTEQVITHDFLGFSIIHMIEPLFKDGYKPNKDNGIEIDVTIDGRAVSFKSLIKRLEEVWEDVVTKEVNKRCAAKLDEIENEIFELQEIISDAKSAIKEKLVEKGLFNVYGE